MGLTKEVRDFFVGRICDVLNAKLDAINKQINEKRLQNLAVQKFCEKWDLPADILAQANALLIDEQRIDKEQEKLKNTIEKAIAKGRTLAHTDGSKSGNATCYNRYNSYYGLRGQMQELQDFSFAFYRDEMIEELYPDLLPQIKNIEHIKGEAQSAVLLATTETKLVSRLSALLKKYGGDISELLELVSDLQ